MGCGRVDQQRMTVIAKLHRRDKACRRGRQWAVDCNMQRRSNSRGRQRDCLLRGSCVAASGRPASGGFGPEAAATRRAGCWHSPHLQEFCFRLKEADIQGSLAPPPMPRQASRTAMRRNRHLQSRDQQPGRMARPAQTRLCHPGPAPLRSFTRPAVQARRSISITAMTGSRTIRPNAVPKLLIMKSKLMLSEWTLRARSLTLL